MPARGRTGSYRLDGLLARFGQDATLPDVLMELASCERRRDFSQPCGARLADLADQKVRQQASVRNPDDLVVEYFEAAR